MANQERRAFNKKNGMENRKGEFYNKKEKDIKPRKIITHVTQTIKLGSSEFYNEYITQLDDILKSIPFSKVVIPVSISKGMAFGNQTHGFMTTGTVEKYDNYEFKVSLKEDISKNIDWNSVVIVPRILKDKSENIVRILSLNVVVGESFNTMTEEDFN